MNRIKTVYFFLLSRIQGAPLTWVSAKFKAASVDEESEICEAVDAMALRATAATSGFRLFKRSIKRQVITTPAQSAVDIASKYFLGRLFICAINGCIDPNYLCNGVYRTN
jgi:hypothetical protein